MHVYDTHANNCGLLFACAEVLEQNLSCLFNTSYCHCLCANVFLISTQTNSWSSKVQGLMQSGFHSTESLTFNITVSLRLVKHLQKMHVSDCNVLIVNLKLNCE